MFAEPLESHEISQLIRKLRLGKAPRSLGADSMERPYARA